MLDEELTSRVLRSVVRRLESLLTRCDTTPGFLAEVHTRTELEQLLSIHAHLTKMHQDALIGVPSP